MFAKTLTRINVRDNIIIERGGNIMKELLKSKAMLGVILFLFVSLIYNAYDIKKMETNEIENEVIYTVNI